MIPDALGMKLDHSLCAVAGNPVFRGGRRVCVVPQRLNPTEAERSAPPRPIGRKSSRFALEENGPAASLSHLRIFLRIFLRVSGSCKEPRSPDLARESVRLVRRACQRFIAVRIHRCLP